METDLLEAEAQYRQLVAETVAIERQGWNARNEQTNELKEIQAKRLAALRECNRLFGHPRRSKE